MTLRKKLQITIICLSVILCTLVTGTIAWLTDKTDPVTNTFAPSNVSVTLQETTGGTYKMIPGKTYAKDPKVTVTTDISCYVFVQVNKSANLETFISYEMADGWKELTGVSGVYYREVSATSTFNVLKGIGEYTDGAFTVEKEVTKEKMDALNESGATQPTLAFTAYAIQKDYLTKDGTAVSTAEGAWEILTGGN